MCAMIKHVIHTQSQSQSQSYNRNIAEAACKIIRSLAQREGQALALADSGVVSWLSQTLSSQAASKSIGMVECVLNCAAVLLKYSSVQAIANETDLLDVVVTAVCSHAMTVTVVEGALLVIGGLAVTDDVTATERLIAGQCVYHCTESNIKS